MFMILLVSCAVGRRHVMVAADLRDLEGLETALQSADPAIDYQQPTVVLAEVRCKQLLALLRFGMRRKASQKHPQYCQEFHGNSSERPSPEPLLKKEASPAVLGGREFWKCSGSLKWLEL